MFSPENTETLFYLDEDYFLCAPLALFREAKSAGKYRLKKENGMNEKKKHSQGFSNFNLVDSQ